MSKYKVVSAEEARRVADEARVLQIQDEIIEAYFAGSTQVFIRGRIPDELREVLTDGKYRITSNSSGWVISW